jgi:hypothetical protein
MLSVLKAAIVKLLIKKGKMRAVAQKVIQKKLKIKLMIMLS